jgi:hypothetical protein
MASRKPKADAAPAANDPAAELVVLPATAPKETDLMAVANAACDGVVAITIDSPMMYELAGVELVELQTALTAMNDQRFSITRPMDAAKAAVMNLFRSPTAILEAKIKAIKASMLAYTQAQQRIADEQKAALARQAQEQAQVAAQEHERAQALMDSGNTEGVAEALTKAEEAHNRSVALQQTTGIVVAATAATNVPTVGGITTAEVWKARVTDPAALLRYIADHPEYLDWIEFKMTGLNDMAKSQRTELRIPGVEAFEEARISASRKAA